MASEIGILDPPRPDIGRDGPPRRNGRGGRGPGGGGGGGQRGESGAPHPRQSPAHLAVTGIWVALAPILMLFLAFVSAYIVRRGVGRDWQPIAVPRILWANTVILLCSSLALERGRAVQQRAWVLATMLLGVAFVTGQLLAWRELRAGGVGIGTTPFSSFFYLLTGTHAVHLAGGILALVAAAAWPAHGWRGLAPSVAWRVVAIYWHFMGALWLGLFALLNLRR